MKYVLAIDQGTTGTTTLLLDEKLSIISRGYAEVAVSYPKDGWVEQNPGDIWESVRKSIVACLEGYDPSRIAAIGITNQRETTILWSRTTGKPIAPAIVWQCRRTAGMCEDLKEAGHEELFRASTGLVLDPYFSGTKVAWILREKAPDPSDTAFGTVDSYLLYRLTGGRVHATEPSNASRTLLFNINSLSWDPALADILGVPMEILPEVKPSATTFGYTEGLDFLPDGIPVAGILGDQQAALFGQGAFTEGEAKCTYGTGAFLLMNTGTRPVGSTSGLITTVAWQVEGMPAYYALEGSSFIAGAAVQWLRDGLGLIRSSAEVEELAATVPDSGGVIFVPALAGLGAPHWRPDARGLFWGMTRATTAGHLARAVLEGIAFQIYDLLDAMRRDSWVDLRDLRVDGGAARNNLMMQFQADILGIDVVRPKNLETTAFGVGLLAGYGAGLFSDFKELKTKIGIDRTFSPAMENSMVEAQIKRWHTALQKA